MMPRAGCYTRPGDDPGNLDLGHGSTSVPFALASVVRRDKHDGLLSDSRVLDALKDETDQAVRFCNRFVILWRAVAVLMAGMIDMVEMDEGKLGPFLFEVPDRPLGGLYGPLWMLNDIGGFSFEQPAKAVPVVKTTNLRGRPLTAQEAEDRWEHTPRSCRRRRNLTICGVPTVGGDAMLFRTGPHDH